MKNYPVTESDFELIKQLNPEIWMVEALKLNPAHTDWCPGMNYMGNYVSATDLDTSLIINNWDNFIKHYPLGQENECINFYFELRRADEDCEVCKGSGYHHDACWISDSFYSHSSPFTLPNKADEIAEKILNTFKIDFPQAVHGKLTYPSEETMEKYGEKFKEFCDEMSEFGHWNNRITEDEAEALYKNNRGPGKDIEGSFVVEKHTAEEWNEHNKSAIFSSGYSHDAINRMILIRTRCERLGIPVNCETCSGNGYVFTEPKGFLSLMLWLVNMKFGASRGIIIDTIEEKEIHKVREYLSKACDRNSERFKKI